MKKILFLVTVAFLVSGTIFLLETGQQDFNAYYSIETIEESEEKGVEEHPNEVEPFGEVETLDEEELISEIESWSEEEPIDEVEPINEVEPTNEVEPSNEVEPDLEK